jgi:hypothetical protein
MASAVNVRRRSQRSKAPVAIIRVPNFKGAAVQQSATPPVSDDGLDAFRAEADAPSKDDVPARGASPARHLAARRPMVAMVSLGVIALLAVLGASGFWAYKTFALTPPTASLSLRTTPEGAQVNVNGQPYGATPVALSLAPGSYQVKLTALNGQERSFDVTLKAGETVVQQVEWAAAPAPAVPTTGALRVQTEPAGQVVFVDDTRRGVSPLTIADLAAGEHRLVVSSDAGTVRRPVTITAGETLNVVVAPHAPAVSAGFLRVTSPVLLQLRANGDLIGNTESARVMLPAGDHEIVMSNEALGFSRTQRVSVGAGRTADVRVTMPNGTLSINAVPWAEVYLNGERLGETPLANISRPIGVYRVTLRHPQLGEKQTTDTVTSKETARLGVDMRQR